MTMLDRPSDIPDGSLVCFARRRAAHQFKDLYAEGMTLVEEVAAYLDGPGRLEAKKLSRPFATAYAAESMRLTSRLMQVASWLLAQKAVFEEKPDSTGLAMTRNKVKLQSFGIASQAGVFAQMPDVLQDLTARSIRIQTRLIQLEAQLGEAAAAAHAAPTLGIAAQWDLLHRSFAGLQAR